MRPALQPQISGHSFGERWSNEKVARVVHLASLGRSSVAIAEALNDGTTSGSIREMLRKWGIEFPKQPSSRIMLTNRQRYALKWRAERAGLEPEEWLRQRAVEAISDGLVGIG